MLRLTLIATVALAFHLMAGTSAMAQDGTAEATPPVTPIPNAPQITIEFTELNDSGLEGEAILYEAGDKTIVELKLTGTGENHPAHIHEGTCDDLQPQSSYDLENVGEEGTSISLVDAPLADLIDGDFAIDLHLSPNELGLLLACADVEGTPEVPATGGGTPTAESATETPTDEATETPEPTTEPTTEPTPSPKPEPTPTPTPDATPDTASDGTGGDGPTTSDGTGADTSAGTTTPAETTTPTKTPVGGTTSTVSDGTQGGATTMSGKGVPIDPTTGLPATTGSGSSLIFPESPLEATIWASGAFSIVLILAAFAIRRGELQRVPVPTTRRLRRLGL